VLPGIPVAASGGILEYSIEECRFKEPIDIPETVMPQKHETSSPMSQDQFIELASAVMRQLPREMDSATAQFHIKNQGDLREFLAGLMPKMEIDHPYEWSIQFDPKIQLERFIELGNYDWVNPTILEKFWLDEPVTEPSGLRKMCLLHFNRFMKEEEVVREMKRAGYRPATHSELIALRAAVRKFTYEQNAVALGSEYRSTGGGRFVVCIEEIYSQDSTEKRVRLDLRPRRYWVPGTRFAAVQI